MARSKKRTPRKGSVGRAVRASTTSGSRGGIKGLRARAGNPPSKSSRASTAKKSLRPGPPKPKKRQKKAPAARPVAASRKPSSVARAKPKVSKLKSRGGDSRRKKRRAAKSAQPKRSLRQRKAQSSKRAASLAAKKGWKTRRKNTRKAKRLAKASTPSRGTGSKTRLPSALLWPATPTIRALHRALLPSRGNELVEVSAIVGLDQTIESTYPKDSPTKETWRSDRLFLGKMRIFDALALTAEEILERYQAAIGPRRGKAVRVLGLVRRKSAKATNDPGANP